MNAPTGRLLRRKVGAEGAGVLDRFAFAGGGAKLPGADKAESFGLEVRVGLGQGVREGMRGRCVRITIFSSSRSLHFIGPLREGRTDAQGGLMALARPK